MKLFVKWIKHNTKSLCLAHLQDVTSKMIPKNYTWAQWALKLIFHIGLNMNWVSYQLSYMCIAQKSLHLVTFLPLCLHLHLSLHVYLYICNGFGLHNFKSFNSLLPYITLQPPMFQHPTSMLVGTSLVLACIILEIIVFYRASPYNLPCFNTLHLHLQKLKGGILRNIVSSQVQ